MNIDGKNIQNGDFIVFPNGVMYRVSIKEDSIKIHVINDEHSSEIYQTNFDSKESFEEWLRKRSYTVEKKKTNKIRNILDNLI